eukprot:GFYU01002855.1.p1 GENE.GFYU01002855.1~~GFYU01002855.1.p1  ORF type:complete len:1004 (+),score=206.65 GFYU01002855.1:122-3133(+)
MDSVKGVVSSPEAKKVYEVLTKLLSALTSSPIGNRGMMAACVIGFGILMRQTKRRQAEMASRTKDRYELRVAEELRRRYEQKLQVLASLHPQESEGPIEGFSVDFFAQTRMMNCLAEPETKVLFEALEFIDLQPGDVLFEGDDECSVPALYVVVSGTMGIFKCKSDMAEDEERQPLYRVKSRETVGDFDIFDVEGLPRRIDCRAIAPTIVAKLKRDTVLDFLAEHPHVLLVYTRQVLGRMWRVFTYTLWDFLEIKPVHSPDAYVPGKADMIVDYFQQNPDVGTRVVVRKGEYLYEVDEGSDHCWIILSGQLNMKPRGSSVGCVYDMGAVIGGLGFINNIYRRNDVTAMNRVELVQLDNAAFDNLQYDAPEVLTELCMSILQLMLPDLNLARRHGLLRLQRNAGERLFSSGENADSMFLIISGRIRLLLADGCPSDYELGRSETVGENSIVASSSKRVHTALCTRDTEVINISKAAFEALCQDYPKTMKIVSSLMAKRMQAENQLDRKTPNRNLVTLAVMAANDATDASNFCEMLTPMLAVFGATLRLNRESILEFIGEETMSLLNQDVHRNKVTTWMTQTEADYRFIILEVDDPKTEWGKICVGQSDCVLIVGESGTDAMPSDEEVLLLSGHYQGYEHLKFSRKLLVLLHENRKIEPSYHPKDTFVWKAARPYLDGHHHIRSHNRSDHGRLARHLAGRAVGLVLSGGGSRGLSHLGVIKAIEDAGIPIDLIGGTSQGAFMAAAYAQCLSAELMIPLVRPMSQQLGSFSGLVQDITFPVIALFSGVGFSGLIREALGTRSIEDLWLNFSCVSTNITTAKAEIHRSGRLWKFVRASMSVVGLLPPVYYNGDLLVDGAYVNNLPIDVMKSMGAHLIIAVDVEDKGTAAFADIQEFDGMSGLALLWSKLNPFAQTIHFPSFGDIMTNLTFISHSRQVESVWNNIDLYLQPPVMDFAMMDYHRLQEMVDVAYNDSVKRIDEWDEAGTSELTKARPMISRAGSMKFMVR